jgi:hypothetical protein
MKNWLMMNPNARLCLAVGATVGISHGLVRIAAALLGPTIGYYVSIAVVAALAYGFCSYFELLLKAKKSTAAK